MSKNCLIRAQDYSIDKYVKRFENLIAEIVQVHPVDHSRESKNYYAEFKAALYFSFSFSLAQLSSQMFFGGNLQAAYRRFRNQLNPINIIKLIYRLSRWILWLFVSPLIFLIAFITSINFGNNNYNTKLIPDSLREE
jgi:hypothetical protein